MGRRGPKPLPDNVHRLNGNPSKKQLGPGGEVPVEIPDAPGHLSDVALSEWGRISQELHRLGLIAKIDQAMLAVYCVAYSRWQIAEGKITELGEEALIQRSGQGYEQIGVWLQISNRAVEQMKSAAAEFGMSPSARVRVNPNPQSKSGGASESNKGGKASPASYFES